MKISLFLPTILWLILSLGMSVQVHAKGGDIADCRGGDQECEINSETLKLIKWGMLDDAIFKSSQALYSLFNSSRSFSSVCNRTASYSLPLMRIFSVYLFNKKIFF